MPDNLNGLVRLSIMKKTFIILRENFKINTEEKTVQTPFRRHCDISVCNGGVGKISYSQ
jgi:hypothetical protein